MAASDGSYPLLGYNYAIFNAEEPENSDVRAFVRWMQSDAGQQVIAGAGYVPYRRVAGLTLAERTASALYEAVGTGKARDWETADYEYVCRSAVRVIDQNEMDGIMPEIGNDEVYYPNLTFDCAIADDEVRGKVLAFLNGACAEMMDADMARCEAFVRARTTYDDGERYSRPFFHTDMKCRNGYLSVTVGWSYSQGW